MAVLDLNIMTWNATGIMSSASYLCDSLLSKNIDICGLSEHWLYEKDLMFLDQLNSNYKSHAVSDFELRYPGRRRVGKGGVALLWHKNHDNKITPLSFEDDRVIGLQYEVNPSESLYIFQVYLPCSNHPVNNFYEYVDKLDSLLGLYSEKGVVMIMGDINANIMPSHYLRNVNNRSHCIMNFLARNNMVSLNTMNFCTGAKSTFVSYDNKSESLIDHILFPVEQVHYIQACEICVDDVLNVSRHRPLRCRIRMPVQHPETYVILTDSPINWKKLDDRTVQNYQVTLSCNETLQNLCNSSIATTDSIARAYGDIVRELKSIARQIFPVKTYRRYLKPYWTNELSALHRTMAGLRRNWVNAGKPRNSNHSAYSAYKSAKRNFRRKHRQASENYMKKQIDEIDNLAEVDSSLFWHHVNVRRKKSSNSPGSSIKFDNKIMNNEREINNAWARYFENLYTPFDDQTFDESFKNSISESVQAYINTGVSDDVCVSAEEVRSAVRMAHRGKACGDDGIFYEHILFGGVFICEILAKLFTAMVHFSYVPLEMKKGVIITLFKGGNKRKDDPDSYRAITLSSVILKLLERVLLTRIQLFDKLTPPIHAMQGGFQKNLGCLMTSFMLRESVFYAKENGSKLYVCFLDVKKAFDCVWHDGLFYKLYNSGVNKSICKLIVNMYTCMFSCVRSRSYKSVWFPVRQGTRQGGVISPFLYLLYINGLLYELELSDLGFCIYGVSCGFPTVADDMLVGSYSKIGLQNMLQICFNYACKWRFGYGILKCLVVVFNEMQNAYNKSNRTWLLGDALVAEGVEYKHLGVICNKYMSIDENIKVACNKIKSTFLSLINSGIYEDGFNPLTSKRIYNSVALPKALYGCELWSNLQSSQLMSLERAHRYCVKFLQFLPRSTSTDVSLALIGMNPIEAEIDRRKLTFFGQLCRLPGDYRVKELFLRRLTHFNDSPSKKL